MLSRKYIQKVARMMYQTGGYSPGAYDVSREYKSAHDMPSVFPSHEQEHSVKIRLEYVVNEKTGDLHIVQKD